MPLHPPTGSAVTLAISFDTSVVFLIHDRDARQFHRVCSDCGGGGGGGGAGGGRVRGSMRWWTQRLRRSPPPQPLPSREGCIKHLLRRRQLFQ